MALKVLISEEFFESSRSPCFWGDFFLFCRGGDVDVEKNKNFSRNRINIFKHLQIFKRIIVLNLSLRKNGGRTYGFNFFAKINPVLKGKNHSPLLGEAHLRVSQNFIFRNSVL